MGEELPRIWQQSRKTVIFITHSADEAIMLSDRIISMGRPPQGIVADLKVGLPRPRTAAVRGLPRFAELGWRFVPCSQGLAAPIDGTSMTQLMDERSEGYSGFAVACGELRCTHHSRLGYRWLA